MNNPAIVYTEELARRGPLRVLARYQAFLFFPLLGLLAWSGSCGELLRFLHAVGAPLRSPVEQGAA